MEGNKSQLHLPEALTDDQGMYMVKAYNQYGMMQCKAMLAVLPDANKPKETAPVFVSKLQPIVGTIGEPVSFSVQLDKSPTEKYKVEWFKVWYHTDYHNDLFWLVNLCLSKV